jgi:tripartite-type tricarboxylate transporter receptor subunit TctC
MTMLFSRIALVAAVLALPGSAAAQDFPTRPIRIVVTPPAGGGVDVVTRAIAAKLQERWGQPVTVENRTGGGGNIGAAHAASSPPDGYTLLATPPSVVTVNAELYKGLSYSPADLSPVAIMALSPNVLAVRQSLPARTVAELVAYAKANPGKLNYASQGSATTSHLTAEYFARLTDTQLSHVPYRGTAPALNDLAGGHVDVMFVDVGSALPLHQSGQVRIIAAASAQRIPVLPDLPTVMEQGIAGFQSSTWYALTAPPKTPEAITRKLNAAIEEIVQTPELKTFYRKLDLHAQLGGIDAMAAFTRDETRRWSEVIRAAKITAD